jgi:phosphate transport system permease protein
MKEKVMKGVFLAAACVSIAAVALICVFLFAGGFPAFQKIGVVKFLTGTMWKPNNDFYGILPMIEGSLYITGLAVLFGVPVGVLTAAFLVFYCPKPIYRPLKAATDLLAGIPSVVYGFFGMVVLVPIVRGWGKSLAKVTDISAGNGSCILTASLILGMMILPSIIGVTESSLRAVPTQYYEGSVALGATHERAIFRTVFPAASSGVWAGIVLGIGRAVGETMAVVMIAGNQTRLTSNIFKGIRTLTTNIVIEMGYATGLHRQALIATGVVLFIFVLIINIVLTILKERGKKVA